MPILRLNREIRRRRRCAISSPFIYKLPSIIATSLYIAKLLDEKDIKVTRLARGIPVGGDLEYIDEATLLKAMEGRTSL